MVLSLQNITGIDAERKRITKWKLEKRLIFFCSLISYLNLHWVSKRNKQIYIFLKQNKQKPKEQKNVSWKVFEQQKIAIYFCKNEIINKTNQYNESSTKIIHLHEYHGKPSVKYNL